MTDAVAVAQGNGVDNRSFQLLIELVRQVGEMSATLRSVAEGQNQLRDSTTAQVALLQERVGKSETVNEVQNERIKQGEQSESALRADLLEMKASISRQIVEMESQHAKDMAALRLELAESAKVRWMMRGGLLVLSVAWPIIWELVVMPLFGK